MKNNSLIAKNTILLSVRMVVVTIITIFTTRFLLEGLGVEDYGVYNVTVGVISFSSFFQPAMANGIQRFLNFEIGRHDEVRSINVFNTGFQIQIVISLLIILICETAGLWYVMNKLVVPPDRYYAVMQVYQIAIGTFIISMIQVPFIAIIMCHERMNFFALISIVDCVLKFLVAVGIKYASFDHLILYTVLLFIVHLVILLIYIIYTRNNFQEVRFQKKICRDLFKPMLSFSGWNLFEKFGRVGKMQGINMLLNYFFGPVVNASRGVVNYVTMALSQLLDSSFVASRPQAIQAYARGEIQRTLNIMFSLSKFTILFLFMLSLPIYLEGPYILNLWLGAGNIPMYTLPFLYVTLISTIIDKLSAPLNIIVHASGKMKLYNTVSGIMNIIVVPFSLIALVMGVDAVFIYWLVFWGEVVTLLVLLLVLKKIVNLSIPKYFNEVIIRSSLVVLLAFGIPCIVHNYMGEGFLRLLFVTASSVLICSLIAFMVGLNKNERELFRGLLKGFCYSRK